jgi:hypothetical protein
MPGVKRRLTESDTLYRVLRPNDPPEYEGDVPLPFGFMDKGRTRDGLPGETLSFFDAGRVSPTEALRNVSKSRLARDRCGTGREPPSPETMYHCRYRVAALRASFVIEACDDRGNDLALETDDQGSTVAADGHVGVLNGDRLAPLWARHARILSRDETLA